MCDSVCWNSNDRGRLGALQRQGRRALAECSGLAAQCRPDVTELTMICDFCSNPDVAWSYPAGDFEAPMDIGATCVSAWLACETCHGLIERGDCGALAERSLTSPGLRTIPSEAAMNFARRLHALFLEHRTGPARKLG
jgi:hypothetical protein